MSFKKFIDYQYLKQENFCNSPQKSAKKVSNKAGIFTYIWPLTTILSTQT